MFSPSNIIIVQAVAKLGIFACGFEARVQAILEATFICFVSLLILTKRGSRWGNRSLRCLVKRPALKFK
ncbi:hypothetical protein BRARA_B01432 [Brassica rapa]|uniref:Uncharacterized protein n=1 Tax=Brassica campestris TaxID=3711 RepID=A0A398A916_BRACM|nr:hypothetical protein BRARA_B01432 [Brassica rapa]